MPDLDLNPVVPVTNGAIVTSANPLPVYVTGGSSAAPFFIADGSASNPSLAFASEPGTGVWHRSASTFDISIAGSHRYQFSNTTFRMGSGGTIGWNSTSVPTANDLLIGRDAANTLALVNGTNAQTFRVYNTFTDASNYERGTLSWASNVLTIGTEGAGTGTTNRQVSLVAGIGLAGAVSLNLFSTNVTLTRGGTTSTQTLFDVSQVTSSSAILFTRLRPTIAQGSGDYTVLDLNPTETTVGPGPHYLIRGRIAAGSDVFRSRQRRQRYRRGRGCRAGRRDGRRRLQVFVNR